MTIPANLPRRKGKGIPQKFDPKHYEPPRPSTSILDGDPIDPSKYPQPTYITDEKWQMGLDPEKALRELSFEDLLGLWYKRRALLDRNRAGSRRDYYEALVRLIFPKVEERPFFYIAIWLLRDNLSIAELARRLGEGRTTRQPVNRKLVMHWVEYTRRQIEAFWQAHKLSDRILNSIVKMEKKSIAVEKQEEDEDDDGDSSSLTI